jgi:hypothetical protein
VKTTIYLRVGRKRSGTRGPAVQVKAGTTPSQEPLYTSTDRILPTSAFAIELDIPDEAFDSAARVVAKLRVPPGAARDRRRGRRARAGKRVSNQHLGRCRECGGHLGVRIVGDAKRVPGPPVAGHRHHLRGESDGFVYCSNTSCRHHSEPHPTGKETNEGPVAA